jgi:hypothetical protein
MSCGKTHKAGRWLAGGLLVVLALSGGCTRRFYRNQADAEVGNILAEKDRFDFWKITNFHVYPNPRARFADPTNPDRPPMPPDDPAVRDTSPNPQRPRNIAWVEGSGYLELLNAWDAENRWRKKEQAGADGIRQASFQDKDKAAGPEMLPAPKEKLQPVDDGIPGRPEHPFLINLPQCAELGMINAREYQTAREQLYLTALPVTQQRFSFAAQYFATEQAVRQYSGRATPNGQSNTWNLGPPSGNHLGSSGTSTNQNGITTPGGVGLTKLFSTGAQLLLQFANQTVIDLGGNLAKNITSVSVLNLDMVQPLLAGAGRPVTLEPLTQAERSLFYQIRLYARFRKLFYVTVATGGDFNSFNVQPIRQGYLPTLLRDARLRIELDNYRNSKKILGLVQLYEEGGTVTPLQVAQARNSVLTSEGNIYQRQQDVTDAYDALKFQLGLPINLSLKLDESPISAITKHLTSFEELQDDYNATVKKATDYDPKEDPAKFRDKLWRTITNSDFVKGVKLKKHYPDVKPIPFPTDFPVRWKAWEVLPAKELDAKMDSLRKERRKILTANVEKDLNEEQKAQLRELDRQYELGQFERFLRDYEAQPWTKIPKEKDPKKEQEREIQRTKMRVGAFQNVVLTFSNVFAEAFNEWSVAWSAHWPEFSPIILEGVDMLAGDEPAYAIGTRIGLENRLDLMNQRARVVDAWRQLAVTANSLLGVANVEYHLTGFSPLNASQPLAVTGSHMQNQLVLTGQLPLVRRLERNNYRAALIDYQAARRALMAAEDLVVQGIRVQIRTLRVLKENYRIQKEQTELAYRLLEQSFEALAAPPGGSAPGSEDKVGSPFAGNAANAAALTNQLLQNQSNLVNQQTQLYTFWINYEATRMQFYRDLELMIINDRGVWSNDPAADEFSQQHHQQPRTLPPIEPQPERLGGDQPERGPRLLPPAAELPVQGAR